MKELNNKQNLQINENRINIETVKEDISDIKKQVFNHLPGKIDAINNKILWGFVVMTASVIITQIILKGF